MGLKFQAMETYYFHIAKMVATIGSRNDNPNVRKFNSFKWKLYTHRKLGKMKQIY